MQSRFLARAAVGAFIGFSPLAAMTTAEAATVATIGGCYDCGVYDTASLIFNNTTGGTLTDAKMVLSGYQGQNNGIDASVDLGSLAGGTTQLYWGSLPNAPFGTTPNNLTAYDYDDEFIGTSAIINDPTCGGGGCAPGGGAQWYAQVGNFSVTFTAVVSGGIYDGQSVYSVFSPNSNVTGGFVGWEGLDPNGYSESPTYDVHTGVVTGHLADIDLGVVPSVPEPETCAMLLAGLVGVGWASRRRGPSGAPIGA